MNRLVQVFYINSLSSRTVTLIPDNSVAGKGSDEGTGLPPHLALQGVLVQTTASIAPSEFWGAVGDCQQFRFTIERQN